MSCALLQAESMICPKYFAYFVVFSCVFVIESIIDSLFDSVQKAVDDYKEETEDLNVDAMKFDVQNYSDGYAADWHPTEKTHAKAAAKLIEKIKEIMLWE